MPAPHPRWGPAALLLGSMAGPAAAADRELELVVELSDLDTTSTAANLGQGLAGLGDVDGDGIDDLGLGAPGSDLAGEDQGAVFLFLGTSTGVPAAADDVLLPSSATTDSRVGYTVAAAGDVDDDGFDDVLLFGPQDGWPGTTWLLMGSASGLDDSAATAFTNSGNVDQDNFGRSMTHGDLDGDGFDDVVCGTLGLDVDDKWSSAGAAYVYPGSAAGLALSAEAQLTASDPYTNVQLSHPARSADFDADGYADLALSAHRKASSSGQRNAGRVYLWMGSSTGVGGDEDASLESASPATGAYLGTSVVVGDVDGDGFDDLVAGAPGDGVDDVGAAHLFFGSSSGLDASSEAVLQPGDTTDVLGFGASAAGGDLDGDGYLDLLIGESRVSPDLGAVHVFFGSAGGVDTSSEQVVAQPAGAWDDLWGSVLASVGDPDDDGLDEVAISAPQADPTDASSGSPVTDHGTVALYGLVVEEDGGDDTGGDDTGGDDTGGHDTGGPDDTGEPDTGDTPEDDTGSEGGGSDGDSGDGSTGGSDTDDDLDGDGKDGGSGCACSIPRTSTSRTGSSVPLALLLALVLPLARRRT